MRVVVGMSGGVDSSVAALLMKRAGHEVIGVFMKNWEEKDESGVCTSERDWADARSVCEKLDIPYYSVNFAKQYMDRVFSHFLEEYKKGRTPNPDVLCNREIKFNVFLDFAEQLGAEKLVTGHFAGVDEAGGEYRLLRAADENKDQTYFLYMIDQHALSKAMFPGCSRARCGRSPGRRACRSAIKRTPPAYALSASGISSGFCRASCPPSRGTWSPPTGRWWAATTG